jgi:hypothetical protein
LKSPVKITFCGALEGLNQNLDFGTDYIRPFEREVPSKKCRGKNIVHKTLSKLGALAIGYVSSCNSPVAAELHSSESHRPGIALQIPVLHLFMFKKTIPPLFPFKMGEEGVEED